MRYSTPDQRNQVPQQTKPSQMILEAIDPSIIKGTHLIRDTLPSSAPHSSPASIRCLIRFRRVIWSKKLCVYSHAIVSAPLLHWINIDELQPFESPADSAFELRLRHASLQSQLCCQLCHQSGRVKNSRKAFSEKDMFWPTFRKGSNRSAVACICLSLPFC